MIIQNFLDGRQSVILSTGDSELGIQPFLTLEQGLLGPHSQALLSGGWREFKIDALDRRMIVTEGSDRGADPRSGAGLNRSVVESVGQALRR